MATMNAENFLNAFKEKTKQFHRGDGRPGRQETMKTLLREIGREAGLRVDHESSTKQRSVDFGNTEINGLDVVLPRQSSGG
jgi:hypothetical protein